MSRINLFISQNSNLLKSETSYNDLNDIFYIFKKAINLTDSFFNFLFSTILFCIKALLTKKKYIFPRMCFYSFFVIILFSLSQSQNITTELIINTYFNKSRLVHISYNNIIKSSKNFLDNRYKRTNPYEKEIKYVNCNENCKEYNYNDEINNNKYFVIYRNDFYLFNYIPLITSLVTFVCFFFLYITVKITYYSKISNSFIINMIGLYFNYKILSYLYSSSFYMASGFIFILFLYFYKCTVDSLYCIFKFNRNDFEIYSIRLCADNRRQFWLKFNLLFCGTLLSGFLSMNFFKLFFNYIAFYLCLFTLIIFLCNCLEKNYLVEYKYSKSILIFILGNINFAVNKILKKRYYNMNNTESNNIDSNINENLPNVNSFYFISDVFSLFCFDYIDDYIEYKYQYYLSKQKKIKKIFNLNDFAFILLFVVFFIISIYGIIFKEYISFFIAFILAKKFNKYFPSIFNYSIGRIFNHLMILVFIFEQYEISTTGDEYIINAIMNLNLRRDSVIILFKFISLLFFLINLIYSNYLYYYSDDCHQSLYHYFKTFNEFININDILQQEYENNNIDNDNDNDENNSDDGDYINFNLDKINDICQKKYKIKIIANNTGYIKIKRHLLAVDFFLCYLDVILTTVFGVYYECNVILKILYLIIICFLLSRKFCLLNEIKGNVFYFIYFVISFIFSSRLIFFTCIDSFYFTFIMHTNMFALLTFYSFNIRRNSFVTIFIITHLFIAYYQKLFTFLLFNLVFVSLALIFMNFKNKEKYRVEKYDEQNSKLSLIFLLSLLTFFLIQLYGINNLFYLMQSGYDYVMNLLNKICQMLSSKNNDDIRLIEYYIITDIIDWIDHKLL